MKDEEPRKTYGLEVLAHATRDGQAGKKFDYGKVPLELLPTEALWEIGKVLAYGATKYDSWNWKKGMAWSRLAGAALRHLFAWLEREEQDQETGLSHLAHAACCILFLLTYEKLGIGLDDRWKGSKYVSKENDKDRE